MGSWAETKDGGGDGGDRPGAADMEKKMGFTCPLSGSEVDSSDPNVVFGGVPALLVMGSPHDSCSVWRVSNRGRKWLTRMGLGIMPSNWASR